VHPVTTAAQAWDRYAETSPSRRSVNALGAETWLNWTQYPDHGPNEAALGEIPGKRVLELGSGSGDNLAHLATLGASCVGVDLAPSRAVAANRTWGHLADLEFVTADVVEYLSGATSLYDIVYSIFGAAWFTDPAVLLPLVRNSMTRGGVLAFSQMPDTGQKPKSDRLITKWNHPAEHWVRMLTEAGFEATTAEIIAAPTAGAPGTLLVRAVTAR
jgi:ubiquinone/menaquinone biosynthesis C-methylase UbiE